jgi:hypothetical protein
MTPWWCGGGGGGVVVFLTDNNTTPTKVVLSCFGLLVGLWKLLSWPSTQSNTKKKLYSYCASLPNILFVISSICSKSYIPTPNREKKIGGIRIHL